MTANPVLDRPRPRRGVLPAISLIAPLMILLGLAYFLPFFGIARWSVTLPEPGFQQYEALVADPLVAAVFLRTLRICTLATLITVIAAYAIAFVWVRGARWQRLATEYCIILPFWISTLTRAFGWVAVLSNRGLINTGLMKIGVITEPLPLLLNEFAVIVGMVHFLIPFAVFPIASSIRNLDESILLAARGMGAGATRIFWTIILPMTKSGIIGSVLVVFIFSLGFYVTPAVLGGGRTVMAAELVWLRILQQPDWGLGSAVAISLVVLVGILIAVFYRFVRPRELVS